MQSTWIDNIRILLEMVSFISGPILVVVSIFALRQISLAKKDIQIRSKREAAHLAISQCEKFNYEISILIDDFEEMLVKNEVPKYEGEIGDFCDDDLMKNPKWFLIWSSKTEKLTKPWCRLLNALEAFAVCFTMGVADEEIAFTAVGLDFCSTVKNLYGFIALTRNRDAKIKQNEHIVNLYQLWSGRLAKYNLEGQLKETQLKLRSIDDRTIKPIGVDVK